MIRYGNKLKRKSCSLLLAAMTELKTSKSIYVVVRSRCRNLGVSVESAAVVIAAFHAEALYSLPDVAARLAAEKAGKGAKETKKETKTETKGDTKTSKDLSAMQKVVVDTVCGVAVLRATRELNLCFQIAKHLPKSAKTVELDAHEGGELPSLHAIIRRVVVAGASRLAFCLLVDGSVLSCRPRAVSLQRQSWTLAAPPGQPWRPPRLLTPCRAWTKTRSRPQRTACPR